MVDAMLAALRTCLVNLNRPVAVAVSGGVDSMTLACVAHRVLLGQTRIMHAVSPAVPEDASARVRRYAEREGWSLTVFNAGEFDDARYLENPVDRCFFCKTHLYAAMAGQVSAGTILLSGTNLDDLSDYRPGLRAAAEHGVRHPYVEAGIDKQGVRGIAGALGLDDLAELPAAPCLSSRIETGIAINADVLQGVDRLEARIKEALDPETVRCRVVDGGIVIELDAMALQRLSLLERGRWVAQARALFGCERAGFEVYRRGRAFRHDL
jgi:uncharacterized protein